MRGKIVYIDTDCLLDILNWKDVEAVRFPVFPQLPADTLFGHVTYDARRLAWAVTITSEEFENIEPGYEFPSVDGFMEYKLVEGGRDASL